MIFSFTVPCSDEYLLANRLSASLSKPEQVSIEVQSFRDRCFTFLGIQKFTYRWEFDRRTHRSPSTEFTSISSGLSFCWKNRGRRYSRSMTPQRTSLSVIACGISFELIWTAYWPHWSKHLKNCSGLILMLNKFSDRLKVLICASLRFSSITCPSLFHLQDILSRSSVEESTAASSSTTSNTSSNETRQNQISKLTDMGFTARQAQIALKRTRFDH